MPLTDLPELQRRFQSLPSPPSDAGRLVLIVRRNAPGIHGGLTQAQLTVDEGLPGDAPQVYFRDIYWRVLEAGEVAVGCSIDVLSRGSDEHQH